MSFTESMKDVAAIIVAVFLILVPLVYSVMYPGVALPEVLVTWATYAIQFLFSLGSVVYGGKIVEKALNSRLTLQKNDE